MTIYLYISNTPIVEHIPIYVDAEKISLTAANFNLQILEAMNSRKCKTISIFNSNLDLNKRNESEIITVNQYQSFIYFYNANFMFKLLTLIKFIRKNRKEKFNIICDSLSLENSLLGLILSKIFRIKIVSITTDLPRFFYNPINHKLKDLLFARIGEFSLHFYNGYVLLSEYMSYEKFANTKPKLVIEGVCNVDFSETQINDVKDQSNKIFIYSGTLNNDSGVLTFMRAFEKANLQNIVFEIYSGDKTYKEFTDLLAENIKFMGYLPIKDLRMKLKVAHLLINPRPVELDFNRFSFPSKLIEYMASGTPVITTNLPNIPKLLLDTLYFFEKDDMEGIQKGLYQFLNSDQLQSKIKGENAKRIIEENYSHLIVGEKIFKLFQEINDEN